MDQFFQAFGSNTLAASGNQLYFDRPAGAEPGEGIVFFRVFAPGTYHYSFMFSNCIDSTYSDGRISYCNFPCVPYSILEVKAAVCSRIDPQVSFGQSLFFQGDTRVQIMPGASLATDPVLLSVSEDQYIALYIRFDGSRIPYYEESIISHFVKCDGSWMEDRRMPTPDLVACDRPVSNHIAFFGDSITAGIGTDKDAYAHWNARLSSLLGRDHAYWNLGIGYGRASDGASGGSWMEKALQNDIVFVCFGVNDLLQGHTTEQITSDLQKIIEILHQHRIRVLLQTLPPFGYEGAYIQRWHDVNNYILSLTNSHELLMFNNVPILGKSENPHFPLYQGHPNEKGCELWANALYEACHQWIKE